MGRLARWAAVTRPRHASLTLAPLAAGLGARGVMKPDPRTLSLSDWLAASKPLARAATKSTKASEARAALPPGSSRARVTTANARWARAAEERDRVAAQLTAEWEAAQEK